MIFNGLKPSTHEMRREILDLGVMTSASQLHHQKIKLIPNGFS